MKFGIMAPYMFGPLEDGGYAAAYGQLVEEMGFESLWAVDHVVMCPGYESRYPYSADGRSPFHEDVVQPDPLIWLTWVAASTRRIRLATGILILPLRNPVVLAKEVASLDRLAGGRLMLGIGVGWVREEAEAVGATFEDRGHRCDEAVEAMRALWREPVSSYAGRSVRFDQVVSRPKPIDAQGVPIVVGGHSEAAARRAGRLGDGFYPLGVQGDELDALLGVMRESAREHDRDPDRIEVTTVGSLDPRSCEPLKRQGVHRMIVSPPGGDLEKLRPRLEEFRRAVIEPYADAGDGST